MTMTPNPDGSVSWSGGPWGALERPDGGRVVLPGLAPGPTDAEPDPEAPPMPALVPAPARSSNPHLARLDLAKGCLFAYEHRTGCGCEGDTRRCRKLGGAEVSLGQCLGCVAGKGLPRPLAPRPTTRVAPSPSPSPTPGPGPGPRPGG